MKRLIQLLLAVIIMAFLGSCTHYYYKKPKPFKPDRHTQVKQCKTYHDVLLTSKDYKKKKYRRR